MLHEEGFRENSVYSSLFYPLLVASLGLGTVSLYKIGSTNIRIWQLILGTYIVMIILKYCMSSKQNFIFINYIPVLLITPLVFSVILSGFNAENVDLWLKQTLLFVAMLLLFFVVSQRTSRTQILQNMRWIIYPGICIAAWGIIEFFIFPESLPSYYMDGFYTPRAVSLFAEANEFSQFLGMPFAFLFSYILYGPHISLFERWFFRFGILLIVLAQVLSFSRGGMIVFIGQVIAWFILTSCFSTKKKSKTSSRKGYSFILVILLSIMFFIFQYLDNISLVFLERIQSLFSGNDITSQIRWDGIILAVSEAMKSPETFIIGLGFGNLPILLGDGVATTANIFADVFSELGLLGLASFCILIITLLILPINTLKYLLKKKDGEMLAIFFGSYLTFIGLLAGGLTYATYMLNFFWLSSGLLFALKKNANKYSEIQKEAFK